MSLLDSLEVDFERTAPGSVNGELPQEVLDGLDYTSIHAAVLFADLEHSVLLSSTEDPRQYQLTINACQATMLALVDDLKARGFFIGEYSVAGDQLALFLYDEDEVRRNYLLDGPAPLDEAQRAQLIALSRQRNEELAFQALRAAISLKNLWLGQDFNLERVRSRRDPLGLGIGIHIGRVYLCRRPDGRRRIEGYTVNLAKRIEGYSRAGRFSRIMFSRETHDAIRRSRRRHTLLRQRIFFHEHQVGLEMLKGITRSKNVYELRFYSRIGIAVPPEIVEQYEALFAIDPENIWAYHQLFEHYAYQAGDWERAYALAVLAQAVHPRDDKVLLDLSRYHFMTGSYGQAEEFAQQALSTNGEFDLAHEQLALIAHERKDLVSQVHHLTRALTLAPGSPVNHLNLGYTLCTEGRLEEGGNNLIAAFTLYPEYLQLDETLANLKQQHDAGQLSTAVLDFLAQRGVSLG